MQPRSYRDKEIHRRETGDDAEVTPARYKNAAQPHATSFAPTSAGPAPTSEIHATSSGLPSAIGPKSETAWKVIRPSASWSTTNTASTRCPVKCFAGFGHTRLASSMARQKQDSGLIRMTPFPCISEACAAESTRKATKELRRDGAARSCAILVALESYHYSFIAGGC